MPFFALALLFASAPLHGQLSPFTLNVTHNDETCPGNGSLSFSVTGTDPAATVSYSIFLHPNLTEAISTLSGNFLGGLESGEYTVVATQTLNGNSNSQSATVTIQNQVQSLDYSVTSTNALCGADGSMTVIVAGGSPVSFEILSGPVTLPPQPSPFFDLLPAGIYVIRVFDNCGEATVVTHTVISDATQVTAGNAAFPDLELPSCNTITAENTLTPSTGNTLSYPLFLEYTVHPPGGGLPVTFNQTISSGSPNNQTVSMVIPFFAGQQYNYDLVITDECGNVFSSSHIVNENLNLSASALLAECGQFYLSIVPTKYRGPFTLNFISFPAGFNPGAFNASYPGPYSASPVEFGSATNPVPFGDYIIAVTDACGRTAQTMVTLEEPEPEPSFNHFPNPGCAGDLSTVEITLPGYTFVSAVITAAPSSYPFTLDHDVTNLLSDEDGLIMLNMPVGNYTVILVDDCGNEYVFDFEVLQHNPTISSNIRADCDSTLGSVRIRGNSTQLLSVIMTAAPAAFTQSLPYDVSFNINASGTFSMAALPPGQYTFTVVDSCNFTHTRTLNVLAFATTETAFEITPHCGSFDLNVGFSSSGFASLALWLQKYDPLTDTWGHPQTGNPYVEGTVPSAINSVSLANNSTTLNLEFTGDFRIMRTYNSFNNGSVSDFTTCFDVVKEFEFTGKIDITGIEKVTCDGFLSDVQVFTNGVPPVYFSIIEKNYEPYFVDNGTNSIFTDLEPAIYKFAVSHSCGDQRTREYDVALLPSLVVANQPDSMIVCDDSSNDGIATFSLTDQNAAIIGTQDPANYTLTYHATIEDAENGTNALPFNLNTSDATIYARLDYNLSADCYSVTSFDVIVNPYPVVQMAPTYGFCEGGSVTVTAPGGFDSYTWSTGATSHSIVIEQPGSYSLEVTNEDNGIVCPGIFNFTVAMSGPPEIDEILFSDWTDNSNTITVVLSAASIGSYLYSIDNVHFQSSPTFTDLPPGPYTVFVKDPLQCGSDQAEIYLLNYPHFFTPNGDGFNDFWRVPFSEVEPNLKTFIYDRYGKLITGFGVDSQGWDGTLNGRELPSTDYWFVVVREDGRTHKGHFAMKR